MSTSLSRPSVRCCLGFCIRRDQKQYRPDKQWDCLVDGPDHPKAPPPPWHTHNPPFSLARNSRRSRSDGGFVSPPRCCGRRLTWRCCGGTERTGRGGRRRRRRTWCGDLQMHTQTPLCIQRAIIFNLRCVCVTVRFFHPTGGGGKGASGYEHRGEAGAPGDGSDGGSDELGGAVEEEAGGGGGEGRQNRCRCHEGRRRRRHQQKIVAAGARGASSSKKGANGGYARRCYARSPLPSGVLQHNKDTAAPLNSFLMCVVTTRFLVSLLARRAAAAARASAASCCAPSPAAPPPPSPRRKSAAAPARSSPCASASRPTPASAPPAPASPPAAASARTRCPPRAPGPGRPEPPATPALDGRTTRRGGNEISVSAPRFSSWRNGADERGRERNGAGLCAVFWRSFSRASFAAFALACPPDPWFSFDRSVSPCRGNNNHEK